MKCPQCKHRFKLLAGDSSPPGVFFFIALATWAIAALLWLMDWQIWSIVSVVIAVFPTVAVFPAILDQTTYGAVQCKQCGAKQRIFPWSL